MSSHMPPVPPANRSKKGMPSEAKQVEEKLVQHEHHANAAEKGETANWELELGSPNGLMRQGWTRNSMKIGDVVTVEGSAAKDGSNIGNARSVSLKDGQRLFAASSQAPATP
jgi:hypothetical protein